MGYGFPQGGIFAPPLGIGGGGGGEFTDCKVAQGLVVKKLGVWYNKNGLQAVQVTYTDDSLGPIHGTQHNSYKDITFAPEETVTKASLWGDGRGKASGHILLRTNKDQELDVGKDNSGLDEYPITIGSGILAGVCGRCGYNIDMLALIFLRPIDRIQTTGLDFGSLPDSKKTIQSMELCKVTQYAKTDRDQNWTFTNSIQKTNTKTFTTTSGHGWGAKIGVKATFSAGVPEVAKTAWEISAEASWHAEYSHSTATTVTDQVTLTWAIGGVMKPGDEPIICTATAQCGKGEFPYKAKTTLLFADPPDKLEYTENGVFSTEQWVDATAKAENSKGMVPTTALDGSARLPGGGGPVLKSAVAEAPTVVGGEAPASLAPSQPAPGFADHMQNWAGSMAMSVLKA